MRVWDPHTGELISTLRGHQKGVWGCEFYPVGHTSALLATCGEDATARLWDTRTRKVALTLSGGHADAVYSLAWSRDGSLIATGSADRTVTVWDPKAGKILRLLKAHTDTVKGCAFTPVVNPANNIQTLTTVGGESALLWDPLSPIDNLLSDYRPHDEGKEVETCGFNFDGSLIATGGRDGVICVAKVPQYPMVDPVEVAARQKEMKRANQKRAAVHVPQRDIKKEIARAEQLAAMTNEQSAWVKDGSGDDTRGIIRRPSKVDTESLLAKRGFGRDGKLMETEEEKGASAANNSTTNNNNSTESGMDDVLARDRLVPLNPVLRRDQEGGDHPMIDAARQQRASMPEEDGAAGAPARRQISDVSSLMKALRDRSEDAETGASVIPGQFKARERPKPKEPSVRQLMEASKPVLQSQPRMRLPSMAKQTY